MSYHKSALSLAQNFIFKAPKIELHAHLNGCVRRSTLMEIANRKQIQFDFSCFETKDMESAFKIFGIIHTLLKDINDIRRVMREVLQDFLNQNVIYLELRTTPKSIPGEYTQEDYISYLLDEMKVFNEEYGKKMQARLILSIDRSRTIEDAQKTIDILLSKRNEKLLVGLDYSGNPFKNTFTDFEYLFSKARKEGIKTTIHVAELPGDICLRETADILKFSPDRLGHFNYFDKKLYEEVISKKIPIEMCPTSNMFTLDLKDMKQHHFKEFFFSGHPVSLNTDDTCVFDTNATEEHLKIAEAFSLEQNQLNSILKNSADMIFDESMKSSLQKKLSIYFGNIPQS